MTRSPLALALMLALGSAHAADATPTTSPPANTAERIAALEARIQALEANAEAMRQQAAGGPPPPPPRSRPRARRWKR